jgi:glycosyltransferase involved in cell wall biosynthesis
VNVLFVNYHNFRSNSAVHIFNLANELVDLGVDAAVCVPDRVETVELVGEPRFRAFEFDGVLGGAQLFSDPSRPTLVHAWTPRENVRKLTKKLVLRHSWPYLVHLEDNEDVVTAGHLRVAPADLAQVPERVFEGLSTRLAHPRRYRRFVEGAGGLTAVMDTLLELVRVDAPSEVIWPAFERALFSPKPPDEELKRELGIGEDSFVVVYHGNAHSANAAEMRSLYLAVALVNRRGLPLRLVRLARDFVDFLGAELQAARAHVIEVGIRPRQELPRYLALADVLVQPGRSDAFNDYRFPSKLPEFLAMGRPVILPRTNIGRFLRDGEECLLLEEGHAREIARKIELLLRDPALRERLGLGGRRFAERNLSWRRSAEKLLALYGRVLCEHAMLGPVRH